MIVGVAVGVAATTGVACWAVAGREIPSVASVSPTVVSRTTILLAPGFVGIHVTPSPAGCGRGARRARCVARVAPDIVTHPGERSRTNRDFLLLERGDCVSCKADQGGGVTWLTRLAVVIIVLALVGWGLGSEFPVAAAPHAQSPVNDASL